MTARRAAGVALLVVLLAGCGTKGDLVLPDPEAPPAAPAEPAEPARQ